MEPLHIKLFVVGAVFLVLALIYVKAKRAMSEFQAYVDEHGKDGGGSPELGLYMERVESIFHSVMAPELFDLVERLGELDEEFKALPDQSDKDAKIEPPSPAILDAVPGFKEGISVLTREHVSNWQAHREDEVLKLVVSEAAHFRAFQFFAEGCARVQGNPEKFQDLLTWKDEPTLKGSTGRPRLYEALHEFYVDELEMHIIILRSLAEHHSVYRDRLTYVEGFVAKLRKLCSEEDTSGPS